MTWYRVYFSKKNILVDGEAELERVKSRKVPRVIFVDVAEIHTCDACRKAEPWRTGEWQWWGLYTAIEDGAPIEKYCSHACRPDHVEERAPGGYRESVGWRRWEPTQGDHEWIRQREAAGQSNVRKFPDPKHPDGRVGRGWCRWCGEAVTEKGRVTWHADCLNEYFLHTNLLTQKRFLIRRDGQQCATCPTGAGYWVNQGTSEHWVQAPYTHIAWSNDLLEVDHIVELWEVADLPDEERRIYFSPENLWLLCPQCHKKKSAMKTAERAMLR